MTGISSETHIQLRLALPEDGNQLAEIAHEAYGKYLDLVDEPPAPILLNYDEVAAAGRTHVAVTADRVLGMVTVEPSYPYLILRNLAVRPSCQGQGVGKRLVEVVEGVARSTRSKGVKLWTRAEMSGNLSFYRSLEYEITHSERNDRSHRIFFLKELG